MNYGPLQILPPSPSRLGLTGRQRDCFLIIENHIASFGHAPTTREIAKMMSLKSGGRVHHLLVALQERGWITFLPGRARSIAIVPQEVPAYRLPPEIDARLRAHCAATAEDPSDVLADAVALFFDEAEGSVAA
jgi:SOS-response transcriptional repressor LexA